MRVTKWMGWGLGVVVMAGCVGLQLMSASCAESELGVTPGAPGATAPAPASGGYGWRTLGADFPARRATAQAEIAEGVRNLEAAGPACDEACPAMVTYKRGVEHLCSVADTKEDAKVCNENKKSLVAAGVKLKPTCPCGGAVEGQDAGAVEAGPPHDPEMP